MTKIKKSLWSAVVGIVMSLALVLGVFTGVKTNKVAHADDPDYGAEFVAMIQQYFIPSTYDTTMITSTDRIALKVNNETVASYTRMEAYKRALTVYELIEDKTYGLIPTCKQFLDTVYNTVFAAPEAVIKTVNEDLGVYISDSEYYEEATEYYTAASFKYATYQADPDFGGRKIIDVAINNSPADLATTITYDESELVANTEAAYDALTADQKQYVCWYTRELYNLKAARAALTTMQGYLTNVTTYSLKVEQEIETGVLYSHKADYDVVVSNYNKLDPSAQETVAENYAYVEGLDVVFADIEAKANTVKTSIENMEYYLEGDMVADPEGEVVVDTQDSYDAVTTALNELYDGRTVNVYEEDGETVKKTYTVAEYESFEAVPAGEKTALATYLTELQNYYDAGETLAEYQADAAEVEEDILPLEVTAENHYKVAEVENEINAVYAEYDALNVPDYNGHNNKQRYIAEDNRAKIEGLKATLDELNAWIKEVAKLVDARNNETLTANSSVADVDAVIAWALENDFAFNVNDKDEVEALIEDYEDLVTVDEETDDEIKVNALADAREVLRLLKEKIDDAIAQEEAKVEELKDLLDTIGDLLAEGVKYSDRVTYDYFTSVYNSLSEASQEELQAEENWGNYDALGEALEEIAKRVSEMTHLSGVREAIYNILYRYEDEGYFMSTEAQMGEIGEVVVASEETINAATEAIAAVYDGSEHVASNQVAYKIAELAYPWAEDVVEVEEEEVNAFVRYQLMSQEEYDKYDAAVDALAALKEEAAAVDTRITELEITHYRNQREGITTLYNDYVALDRGDYNNLQDWLTEGNSDKIEDAHSVLVNLDRWVYSVACAVDEETVEAQLEEDAKSHEAADYVVTEATAERIPVELTLAEIEALLETYEQFTVEADNEDETAVRQLSVKEAYDLLVARQGEIEREIASVQAELDALSTLLEEGVKYADREVYEELVQKLEELDPDAEVDTKNLDALEEALDVILERAVNLGRVIESILYRYYDDEEERYDLGTYEVAGEDGEVVVNSRESVEAAQAAVAAVYNGSEHTTQAQVAYKIASLTYPWAEDVISTADEEDVNAFVYYFGDFVDVEGYFARYEAAVEAIEERKELVAAFETACDALELSVENNYKVKEEEIEELYAQYDALNLGELDNVQDWVDEPRKLKVEDAKETLDALNAWLEEVAKAIDEEATEAEGADAVIAAAKASVAEGNELDLTLTVVNRLLDGDEEEEFDGYYQLTQVDDETETAIREASVKDAYDLLVARKEAIETAAEQLQAELDELETEGVTYTVKDLYEELLARAEELEELGVEELDTENLEIVGAALEEIEERTNALKTAIDNIEYYLEGEMVKDPTGEVVYDTKRSLEEATAKVLAVYDGTENIAELEFPWGETEEEALDKWSELTGITAEDLAQYKAAYDEFNRLWDIEKAVAERIDALTLSAENHLQAQAEVIETLAFDAFSLMHEGQVLALLGVESDETYNMHNNWMAELTQEQIVKSLNSYMYLVAANAFDLEVAQFVDATVEEEATIAEVDALLAEILERGFDDQYTFDLLRIEELKTENTVTVYLLSMYEELLAQCQNIVDNYDELHDDLYADYQDQLNTYQELLEQYQADPENYDEPEEPAEPTLEYYQEQVEELSAEVALYAPLKEAYVASVQSANDVLEMLYTRARELNNDLAEKIVDICERAEEDALVEEDYDTILYVKEAYEQLTDVQKAILENTELQIGTVTVTDAETGEEEEWPENLNNDLYYEAEPAWLNIDPWTMGEFFAIATRFEGANYYKQAVEELVTQLGEEYFTVEGYVLEKGLLAMYFTFDDEMKAMVESAYHKLLNIDAAYKEVQREDYTSYTSVTEDLEGQLADAKTELEEAQAALEADIIEALGVENVETVKEALEAYKAAVEDAQERLEAAKDALVESITNSLDPEAETVEKAFENYKKEVADAQAELEEAQAELVTEIKTALGDEEAESVQKALAAYKAAVEETQAEQAQTQAEAAKAAEDGNKENDEKIEKLKKALLITAIAGGVVAVAAVTCIIVLFAKMSALGGAAAGSSASGAASAKGGKKE